MPLLKDGKIEEDYWVRVADGVPLPANAPAIVSLPRWRAERDALLAGTMPLGVLLGGDDLVEEIAEDADRFGLIALEFPTFKDGRHYSTARLLRERYGFTGELRAVGNVLRDQFAFMQRCGFDAFEVGKPADAAAYDRAEGEIGVAYQPDGVAGRRERAPGDLRAS